MKRKWMSLIVLLVVLSLLVAACGQATEEEAEPTSAEPAQEEQQPAAEPVTISFGSLAGLEGWYGSRIEAWEAATGNKVALSEAPMDQWLDKLMTDLQAGAESYDVLFVDDSWIPFLGANEFAAPLAEYGYGPDPDIPQPMYDMGSWPPPSGPVPPAWEGKESQPIAVPIMGHTQMFIYRNDILTTPPETVDDLIALLEENADPANNAYGYVHRGLRGNPIVVDFLVWMWTYGGGVFDEEWACTLNAPETVEALQQYIDLLPLAPPGVASFNQDEVMGAMLNGSSLAGFTWPIIMPSIDDPEASRVSGKIGIMPFPKGRDQATLSGSWYLAVTATSEHKEVAADFVQFMTSAESQMVEATNGMPVMRKSVLTDPELSKTYWWNPATAEALEIARPRATFPEWPKVEDIFGTYLSTALIGEMTPQEAMDQACVEITAEMDRAGYFK